MTGTQTLSASANTAPVRIMGIDPGSRYTGVGLVDVGARGQLKHVHHAALSVGHAATFPLRLKQIFDQLTALAQTYQPSECAIEQVFMARNPSSALKLGQARGAAICALSCYGVIVSEYAATEVKQAVVGKGRAEKKQVQHMVSLLLNLHQPLQEDAADALAIAVTHAHMRQTLHRLGLSKKAWRRR